MLNDYVVSFRLKLVYLRSLGPSVFALYLCHTLMNSSILSVILFLMKPHLAASNYCFKIFVGLASQKIIMFYQ